MNFLLHRELSLRELRSPVAGIGAMLPDLWRMADRRVRAVATTSDQGELSRGVEHHVEADRWFHATEVFTAGERATCRALIALGVPKLGRFGHIAWELCLDGALLLDRDFSEALAALRHDLDRVDEAEAQALADLHGAATLDAGARSRFQGRMRRIFEGLREGSWIAGYCHGAGLAQRVEGIRVRVGLAPFEPVALNDLAAALDLRLEAASADLPRLLDARRKHREAS